MSPMVVSGIVFGVVFGGALLGMILHARLPKHHLSEESKDVVKLGMGLIATITALVLGLLTASAKSSFDAQRSGLAQLAANLVLLDRILAHYGSETQLIRVLLRNAVAHMVARTWPKEGPRTGPVQVPPGGPERIFDIIQALRPKNEAQRSLQAAALKTGIDLTQARWLLFAEKGSSLPEPFLVVMVFWLAVLFASFSLFAQPNATVVTTLLVCALSVAGAVFLILELDRPFEGLIRISGEPLERALEMLGR
jgi:hypothetical protein